MSKKVIDYGGRTGEKFDDGVYDGINDGVRKVIVGEDTHGVKFIKIEYVKNGKVVQKEHGRQPKTQIAEIEFEVNCPDEYITSICGAFRNDNDRHKSLRAQLSNPEDKYLLHTALNMASPMYAKTVTQLQFKTSYGRTSRRFGVPGAGSRDFVLEGEKGTKLVGLHGRSGDFLDSIGAYFAVVSSAFKHLEPRGGPDGVSWDDGAYDRLRKVCFGEDGACVSSVEFNYVKGNGLITHRHGKDSEERKEFVLKDEDDEYVKSVEGTIHEDGFVSSLIFRTSMDRSSEEFGVKFVLEAKGFGKIVGFRGRSRFDRITALGAHFAVVVAPPVRKLEAKGGVRGNDWDDGFHDDVRMITVRYDDKSVKSVKFEYINGPVIGDAHGDIHKDDKKSEFKLYFNNEYVTSVEGHYGQKLPSTRSGTDWSSLGRTYMTMIKFNTNRTAYEVLRHSPDYTYKGTPFKFEEKGHKIVGFHGKTEVSLNQIGVYVKPIGNDA